jgi:Zn-finger protein
MHRLRYCHYIPYIYLADAEKGVKYISVNNAVLLCEDCANQHKKLHSGISYVMSIADAGDTYSL